MHTFWIQIRVRPRNTQAHARPQCKVGHGMGARQARVAAEARLFAVEAPARDGAGADQKVVASASLCRRASSTLHQGDSDANHLPLGLT